MLSLASETGRAWLERAIANLDEILVDHAHCEKKAASTAVSLLFKYPEQTGLLAPLSGLAREELGHFELVLEHLAARGLRLRRLVPSPYAERLMTAVRKPEPDRLVDTLLCLSLIEARSCERMTLLAEAVTDPSLAGLYRGLLASEARHHRTYVELAAGLVPEVDVRRRLAALATHEATVLAAAPAIARFHA